MGAITILDGGMGKELQRIGAPFRQPEWSALALWEAPDMVAQAHRNFVDAGADVLITNTYAVVPYHIGEDRFSAEGAGLIEQAARIARQVADASDPPVRVAGSLPPLFGSYQPEKFEPERAPSLAAVMVGAQAPFVDLWLAETLGSVAELAPYRAATAGSPLPFWASFSLQDHLTADGRALLHSGESVPDAARAAKNCDALLFNCARPEVMGPAIAEVVATLDPQSRPQLGAYANAFPAHDDPTYSPDSTILGRRDDLTGLRYADIAAEWIDAGATIVGGCCGMHPEQIAALAARFGRGGAG